MTEEEIDVVAEELAKVGGASWYPGRSSGPVLRALTERYRDRARVAIAALDRVRASRSGSADHETAPPRDGDVPGRGFGSGDQLAEGTIVVYRPPGDQRAVICRIERMDRGRAYLVPCPRPDFGWVRLDDLVAYRTDDDRSTSTDRKS